MVSQVWSGIRCKPGQRMTSSQTGLSAVGPSRVSVAERRQAIGGQPLRRQHGLPHELTRARLRQLAPTKVNAAE